MPEVKHKYSDEETQEALTYIRNTELELDQELLKKVIDCIKFKGNTYIEKTNNWIIISFGAIFSVLFSNIEKAGKIIDVNPLKTLLVILLLEIAISILSKTILSIYRIHSEHVHYKLNENNLRLHTLKERVTSTVLEHAKTETFSENAKNIIFSTKKQIDDLVEKIKIDADTMKTNLSYRPTMQRVVLSLMSIQVAIFFSVVYILFMLFLPK